MKKLKFWLLILPLFTIACSEENTNKKTETPQVTQSFKTSESAPYNPYDRAGEIHKELSYILDRNNFNFHSIEEATNLIDSISKTYPELDLVSAHVDLSKKISDMRWILNNNDAIDQITLSSTLTEDACSSLCLFLQSLIKRDDNPNEDLRYMILGYQESVQNNGSFSSDDKQIMLTTATLALNSVERKRKDKDWETSVSKMAATVLNADQNIVLSLKMALIVGICQKKNITQ